MNNWRRSILEHFAPNISNLTIVVDPDGLLLEEKLATALVEKGFDVIEFEDPVLFRFAYESKYRSIWDFGEHGDLVVVLRSEGDDPQLIPYDLLKKGRMLSFGLGKLFPQLSYPVISSLPPEYFDVLYTALHEIQPERLGENQTKDFILRYVFKIDAHLISSDIELLKLLLTVHYKRLILPQIIGERIVEILKKKEVFSTWNLNGLVLEQSTFLAFLQERWPIFVEGKLVQNELREDSSQVFNVSGPSNLPFEHDDIHVYIDNLFADGRLSPLPLSEFPKERQNEWFACGVIYDESVFNEQRVLKLYGLLQNLFESNNVLRYAHWQEISSVWAEIAFLFHQTGIMETEYHNMQAELNKKFQPWLIENYNSLINMPASQHVMVHHIARYLARQVGDATPIALIVVDGLSQEQWIAAKSALGKDFPNNLSINESSSFAWVPTLTSVSRQAIFSGKNPMYFPDSLYTTGKEENHWIRFWEDVGYKKNQIGYKRNLGDGDAIKSIEDVFVPGKTKVLGLVVNTVDDIMHGMQLGAKGMINQVTQWVEIGYLRNLVNHLLDNNFKVCITSDHGNIDAVGMGRPKEGVLAESKGERVRIFSSGELRDRVYSELSDSFYWRIAGLPEDCLPVFAEGKNAFVIKGSGIVGHGGTSIEEVIVPFIEIQKVKNE